MQKPRAWVIGFETDSDIVSRVDTPNADDVAAHRVQIIVTVAVSATNNTEFMLKNI